MASQSRKLVISSNMISKYFEFQQTKTFNNLKNLTFPDAFLCRCGREHTHQFLKSKNLFFRNIIIKFCLSIKLLLSIKRNVCHWNVPSRSLENMIGLPYIQASKLHQHYFLYIAYLWRHIHMPILSTHSGVILTKTHEHEAVHACMCAIWFFCCLLLGKRASERNREIERGRQKYGLS